MMIVHCVAPHARIGARSPVWFHVCGVLGAIVWLAAGLLAAALHDLSAWPLMIFSAEAGAVFLVLVLATKVVTGEERLTYYHHEITILAVTTMTLHLASLPVLAYLDVVAIGFVSFLVCGRIGCLLVGCCHGRPARHGIVYGRLHVREGFPDTHAGLAVVPVQLLEAFGAAAIGAISMALIAKGAPDGVALFTTLTGYCALRFSIEFLRGDVRPSWAGLSEAQWTSAVIAGLLVVARFRAAPGLTIVLTVVDCAVIAGACMRVSTHRGRRRASRQLRQPSHEAEVLGCMRADIDAAQQIAVMTTSLGLVVSVGSGEAPHRALSWPGHTLVRKDKVWASRLVAVVDWRCQVPEVVERGGVLHVG